MPSPAQQVEEHGRGEEDRTVPWVGFTVELEPHRADRRTIVEAFHLSFPEPLLWVVGALVFALYDRAGNAGEVSAVFDAFKAAAFRIGIIVMIDKPKGARGFPRTPFGLC